MFFLLKTTKMAATKSSHKENIAVINTVF